MQVYTIKMQINMIYMSNVRFNSVSAEYIDKYVKNKYAQYVAYA